MPAKKNKKRNKNDLSLIKKVALFFLSFTALKIYFVFFVLLVSYVVVLDAQIRKSFEGKRWQLPARVYARPLEIYLGKSLSALELERELKNLGYRSSKVSKPGTYVRLGSKIVLYSRGHTFWDGEEHSVKASVLFSNDFVVGLEDDEGRLLDIVRLDPMPIGSIYPKHKEDRILVRLEEVPLFLQQALILIEDGGYYDHHGISLKSIVRAALVNIKSGQLVQGGSTITQQLVKNFFLSHKKSFVRKIKEAIMAVLLELHYSKDEILEAYFNEVYLGQSGSRAIHGFGLASQHYFNRPLNELSIEKMALLVALVRGASYYDPWRNTERVKKRRDMILEKLYANDMLSRDDLYWARLQSLNLGKKSHSQFVFPAYIDLVKRQLAEFYNEDDLTSNGLRIYTSFDPLVQFSAETAVKKHLERLGKKELETALVVTHPSTGEVLSMIGSRNSRFSGFNRALDGRRSVGSIIKPFVYMSALEDYEKYNLATMVSDEPISIVLDQKDDKGERVIWSPRNFDRESHGEVPLIVAFAKSYNQATARLGQQVGLDAVAKIIKSYGFERRINKVPSLYIGTIEMSPFEVATLYQTIAADGFLMPLKSIRSVVNAKNIPLKRFPLKVEQVGDSELNTLIEYAMSEVGKIGSGRYAHNILGPGFSFAGKTGTSGQQRDSWFAGYSADLLAVAWIGYDDNRSSYLTGSSGALPIWTQLFKDSSKSPLPLTVSENIEMYWTDLQTGQKSKKNCLNAAYLPYIKGSKPEGKAKCRPSY